LLYSRWVVFPAYVLSLTICCMILQSDRFSGDANPGTDVRADERGEGGGLDAADPVSRRGSARNRRGSSRRTISVADRIWFAVRIVLTVTVGGVVVLYTIAMLANLG